MGNFICRQRLSPVAVCCWILRVLVPNGREALVAVQLPLSMLANVAWGAGSNASGCT